MSQNKIKWEFVYTTKAPPLAGPLFKTYRAEVPGGWLVKFVYFMGRLNSTHALNFMPDPGHIWKTEENAHWEHIGRLPGVNWNQNTWRYPVHGGWLIADIYVSTEHFNAALVFLPGREWELTSGEEEERQ